MAEVLLYGVIGDPADKLDAATVTAAIRASTGPLTLRINSPGGFVMEGLAIVAALRAYAGPISIYIDGLAASMASVIAMIGSDTVMAESALMMIHRPWDSAIGDAAALRAQADVLDRIEQQMIAIYAQRTGLPEPEIAGMLAAETWFNADQALAAGFVTSIVPPLKLAAMANATGYGFRHLPDRLKESPMPDIPDSAQAVATERTRIATIMALSEKHRIPGEISRSLIERGTELGEARATLLDYLAGESDRQMIGGYFGGELPHNQHTLDNPANRAKAMSDALAARMMNKPAEGAAAQYRSMSLIDMAREALAANGVRDAYRLSADRVAAMVMRPERQGGAAGVRNSITQTTSDFPDIMQTGINTTLAAEYQSAESPLKQLTQTREVPNFKDQTIVRADLFGTLDLVNEGGEYKYKSLFTDHNSFNVKTYGNMINFSRQMLVNDSLGALGDITVQIARAAANNEAILIAAAINSNPALKDGQPWFSAAHNNLATTASAPMIASLDAGRVAMRNQKDLDGVTFIDARPKYLVVPASLETAADVLVRSQYDPDTANKLQRPNPFFNVIEPISDPRLTGTAWYLFADPAFAPAFIAAYLTGQPTPFTDQQLGWEIDGIEYKVRHDFGVGIVDPKLAYKNPGA